RGWALIGLAGVLGSALIPELMVSTRGPLLAPLIDMHGPEAWRRVGLSLFGSLHLGLGLLLIMVSQRLITPLLRAQPGAPTLSLFMTIALITDTHDVLLRLGLISSTYVMDHLSVLGIALMSHLLMKRFLSARRQLRERTEELQERLAALERMRDRLVHQEQLAAVGELSAVIAHEVRNPISIIKNALASLRRQQLPRVDRATLLDILEDETNRLNRLVRDLLAYARPVTPRTEEISLPDLLSQLADRASAMSEVGIEVQVEIDEAPPAVFGDPDLLLHALSNITDNAVQAMPEGGTLTIRALPSTVEDGLAARIVITDSGEGMDTLVRSRAQAPFFTTRASGTGLGLAIVERIVGNHGGRVEIESTRGRGTRVVIDLPAERTSRPPLPVPEGTLRGSPFSAKERLR
ncbi:MAG: ATP-binding protein, partial [Myxococcales bacterium]|nr:ATP-binding protein [Myxococcales bacterium]